MVAIYREDAESLHDPVACSTDAPSWGDAGPLMQHEREDANYPVTEQLTFDTQINRLLGQDRLVNGCRVMVEAGFIPELIVDAVIKTRYEEVRINLSGQNTVACQISGLWSAGTMSFSVSNDGQNWNAISGIGAAGGLPISGATAAGLYRFNVAGCLMFKVSSSATQTGAASIRLVAGVTSLPTPYQNVSGNVAVLAQSGRTPYEALTMDSYVQNQVSLARDALSELLPWNPKGVYSYGDTVLWNGQVYQCILLTLATYSVPSNTTYWQVDFRQNKSLITTQYASPPSAARMRVEIDMDGYQYRLAESQLLTAQLAWWQQLAILQQGGYGQGASGMTCYAMEEIQ